MEHKSDLYDQFLKMELHEDLFSRSIHGIPIWDSIRLEVNSRLAQQYGLSKQAHDSNWQTRSLPNTAVSLIKSLTTHNPLFGTNKDLLAIGTSRRKFISNEWTDIHLDYFLEELERTYIYLDRPYQLTHFYPARTENTTYTDILEYPVGLLRLFGKKYYSTTSSYSEICEYINDRISLYFDQPVTVNDLVYDEIVLEKSLKKAYAHILGRVDPDAVLLTVGYDTRRLLIRACNDLSIPVIECQHGIITPYHLGYSYAKKVENITYPDYIFTWGDFWSQNISPPISDDRIISIGYPHFEQNTTRFNKNSPGDGVLFISQGTVGEHLSKLAVSYSNKNPSEPVIYKLHPGEYKRWKSEYPWLINSNVTVIDNDRQSLYKFFEECAIQIGVNSTALFEGLAFNMTTYIYQVDGCETMKPVVDAGFAEFIDGASDIVDRHSSEHWSSRDFFSESPQDKFEESLTAIINGNI